MLGDWPPDLRDQLDSALALLLNKLGDDESDEQQAKWYKRAAGAVGKLGVRVVTEVFMGEMRRMGGGLQSIETETIHSTGLSAESTLASLATLAVWRCGTWCA